jgi:tRNA (mo5U34)-methyltransferase
MNKAEELDVTESDELKSDIFSRQWYHRIPLTLPSGEQIVTPGWAPLDVDAYRVTDADVKGKRVLDIGSWDGFWAFRAYDLGASSVMAIDDFSDELGAQQFKRNEKFSNFDLIRNHCYRQSMITRYEISVYDLSVNLAPAGFGVIFAFGLLYHLKHPTYALERLLRVAQPGCTLFVESAILDDVQSPYSKRKHDADGCYAELYPGSEFGNNPTNWSVPTLKGLAAWLQIGGWSIESTWKLTNNPTSLPQCRGFAKAVKRCDGWK